MQALILMIVYILTVATLQAVGFLISQVAQSVYPTLGLMTFLILFLGAFGMAFPIAVWITEKGLEMAGIKVEGQTPVIAPPLGAEHKHVRVASGDGLRHRK